MQTKHWYQSKTIWASILGFVISALEIAVTYLNGGGIDGDAVMTLLLSAYAYYGRIKAQTVIK